MKAAIALTTLLVLSTVAYIGYEAYENKEEVSAFLQETDGQTIYGFTTCNLTKCKYNCEKTDKVCNAAAISYYNCYAVNKQCQKYEEIYTTAQAYDPLPSEWYLCQSECKPADMGNFAKRYNCIQECGK